MSNYAKWIAGGLGWAISGPIGAVVGFVLGSLFDNATEVDRISGQNPNHASGNSSSRQKTYSGDFDISMVILSEAAARAAEEADAAAPAAAASTSNHFCFSFSMTI